MARFRSVTGKFDRFHYVALLVSVLAFLGFLFSLLTLNLALAALSLAVAGLTFLVVLADRRMRIGFMRQNEVIQGQNAILNKVLAQTQEIGQSGLLPSVRAVQTGLEGVRSELRSFRADLKRSPSAPDLLNSNNASPLVVSGSDQIPER